MGSELRHAWLRKGEQAEDHKYTRRVWRNGRWVYYYDDGTTTTDYPKGQNYKTVDQVKRERAATEATVAAEKAEQASKEAKREERNVKIDSTIKRLINKGKTQMSLFESIMSSRVSDLPDMIDWYNDD